MTPEQIVLATDFSPASLAALSIAGRVARIFKVKVLVVHVFQFVAHHQYHVPVGWMIECIRRDVRQRMNETRKVLADMGVETEGKLIEDGFPAIEIPNVIQSCKNPILVMGTHAIGGMDRFLLGSTAEEVLRRVSCPVITVGPHVISVGADPCFHKVLYATDFTETSLAAVPFAAALQKSSSASLRVLHVSSDDQDFHVSSEDQSFDPVRKALGREDARVPAEYVTLHGKDISQAITNEAERFPADLLVLGVRRASAYASHLAPKIAFQVIAAAPCAVLTVSS